jgi:hypothetical protein
MLMGILTVVLTTAASLSIIGMLIAGGLLYGLIVIKILTFVSGGQNTW